jgi:hypothetical protein
MKRTIPNLCKNTLVNFRNSLNENKLIKTNLFPLYNINACKRQAILPLSFQTKRFFSTNFETNNSFNTDQTTSEKIIISRTFFKDLSFSKKFTSNSTFLKFKEIQDGKILEVFTKEQNNNLTKNAEIYKMNDIYSLIHCDEKYKKEMDEIFEEIKSNNRLDNLNKLISLLSIFVFFGPLIFFMFIFVPIFIADMWIDILASFGFGN